MYVGVSLSDTFKRAILYLYNLKLGEDSNDFPKILCAEGSGSGAVN